MIESGRRTKANRALPLPDETFPSANMTIELWRWQPVPTQTHFDQETKE